MTTLRGLSLAHKLLLTPEPVKLVASDCPDKNRLETIDSESGEVMRQTLELERAI